MTIILDSVQYNKSIFASWSEVIVTQRKNDVKNFWAESEDNVVGSGMPESTAEWYVVDHCANVRERMCGGFLDLRGQLAESKDQGSVGS